MELPFNEGPFRLMSLNRMVKKKYFCFLPKILVYFLFSFGAAFLSSAAPPGGQEGPPPLVAVETVKVRNVNPPAEYVGHVEAIQAVDLRARVEGFLEKVNFREGDYVHAGDLLYLIEQAPYQARLNADQARVDQARAEFLLASQNLRRLQSALPESVPAIDLDQAVAAELQAKARLNQAEADLARSQLDMDYTRINSPIDGRIGPTVFTRGNLVGPSSVSLSRVVQMDPIRVVFSVSENDRDIIQKAQKDMDLKGKKGRVLVAGLRLSDDSRFDTKGVIDFVDNEVDRSTGTIAIRAEFENPDGKLIPGQYVNVLLTLREPKMLPVVPQAAVQQDHKGAYVLVVDKEEKAEIRRVETGAVLEDVWVIESGLSEGEKVIFKGIQKVQPGGKVKISADDSEKGR